MVCEVSHAHVGVNKDRANAHIIQQSDGVGFDERLFRHLWVSEIRGQKPFFKHLSDRGLKSRLSCRFLFDGDPFQSLLTLTFI
jgi:hypothetical protein